MSHETPEAAAAIEDLGYRLRRARRDAGELSLRDLSRRTNHAASPSTVQRALSGKVLPAWRVVDALLRLGFGIDKQTVDTEWRPLWVAAKDLVDPLDPPVRPVDPDTRAGSAVVHITTARAHLRTA
ncbi:helix-turn-helix domain-containing protein [Saccharothrix obliqua]|uniref:helix-turn-helix domain-containing protein n=1 Tax=Saccharothrix obliqua TaxID=2861747 RepID=UPI001C5F2159|nr:helix-turn-helix transcriptional regulator [Saccharothrix obliqua]MBW4719416.1 helix-turn-helix domain-containing protein [Saccharothrix obliqua]